jgi:hypothetical protein
LGYIITDGGGAYMTGGGGAYMTGGGINALRGRITTTCAKISTLTKQVKNTTRDKKDFRLFFIKVLYKFNYFI